MYVKHLAAWNVTVLDRLTRHYDICRSYADRWLAGEKWPPLYLGLDNKTLVDGHHRLGAAILLGHEFIDVLHMRPPDYGNAWKW